MEYFFYSSHAKSFCLICSLFMCFDSVKLPHPSTANVAMLFCLLNLVCMLLLWNVYFKMGSSYILIYIYFSFSFEYFAFKCLIWFLDMYSHLHSLILCFCIHRDFLKSNPIATCRTTLRWEIQKYLIHFSLNITTYFVYYYMTFLCFSLVDQNTRSDSKNERSISSKDLSTVFNFDSGRLFLNSKFLMWFSFFSYMVYSILIFSEH